MAQIRKHGQEGVIGKLDREGEERRMIQVWYGWRSSGSFRRYDIHLTFSFAIILSSIDLDFLVVFSDCFSIMDYIASIFVELPHFSPSSILSPMIIIVKSLH